MNTEIQLKIKLNKDKEIILNQKEAKKLYEELKTVFEEKITKEYIPYRSNDWWYPYPQYPIITYTTCTDMDIVNNIIENNC